MRTLSFSHSLILVSYTYASSRTSTTYACSYIYYICVRVQVLLGAFPLTHVFQVCVHGLHPSWGANWELLAGCADSGGGGGAVWDGEGLGEAAAGSHELHDGLGSWSQECREHLLQSIACVVGELYIYIYT